MAQAIIPSRLDGCGGAWWDPSPWRVTTNVQASKCAAPGYYCVVFVFPGEVGRIMGRRGENMQRIEKASGAKVAVDKNSGRCEILGRQKAREKGLELILEEVCFAKAEDGTILKDERPEGLVTSEEYPHGVRRYSPIKVWIQHKEAGLVIGRGGDRIRGIMEKTGVDIKLDERKQHEGSRGFAIREVRLMGDKEKCTQAKKMILDLVSWAKDEQGVMTKKQLEDEQSRQAAKSAAIKDVQAKEEPPELALPDDRVKKLDDKSSEKKSPAWICARCCGDHQAKDCPHTVGLWSYAMQHGVLMGMHAMGMQATMMGPAPGMPPMPPMPPGMPSGMPDGWPPPGMPPPGMPPGMPPPGMHPPGMPPPGMPPSGMPPGAPPLPPLPPLPPGTKPPKWMRKLLRGQKPKALQDQDSLGTKECKKPKALQDKDSASVRSRSRRGSAAGSRSGSESCASSRADSVSSAPAAAKPLAIKERAESSASSASDRGSPGRQERADPRSSTARTEKAAHAARRCRSRHATARRSGGQAGDAAGSGTSSGRSRSRSRGINGQARQRRQHKNGIKVRKEVKREEPHEKPGLTDLQDRLARLERSRKRKVLMSDL